MVGLAQMVRASDCGPEGHQFDPGIPPHMHAGIVQRLVYKFSKLGMAVRFRLPAPVKSKNKHLCLFLVFMGWAASHTFWPSNPGFSYQP